MSEKSRLIADLLRTAIGSKRKIQPTSAIIAAGGSSSRMGNADGITKQHMTLDGLPVIVHTLLAFERCELIGEIVVVAREDEIPRYAEYKERYGITKLSRTVSGGSSRQESVLRGFEAIDPKTKFVAIHDGARCLITPEMIEKVCREAYVYKAATAATLSVDTVKRTEKGNGFVAETLDRNNIWLAQTPQVFDANLYRAASFTANQKNFFGTDDCSLAENIGFNSIKLVECGRENIKITTPDDLIFARAILALRAEKEKENENR